MRADLVALSPEAVAALSNMGLVKRALKEIGEGKGPLLSEAPDGTVEGRFQEAGKEVVARLIPKKTLTDCPCSCGASTVCRHRVAMALAYRSWIEAAAPPAEAAASTSGTSIAASGDTPRADTHPSDTSPSDTSPSDTSPSDTSTSDTSTSDTSAPVTSTGTSSPSFRPWNPGDIPDEAIAEFLGKKAMEDARKTRRRGIVVDLRMPLPGSPTPVALLPTCSVRFLVPGDLAYARCDCKQTERCAHMVLAVWAFRLIRGKEGERHAWTVEVREEGAPAVATQHRDAMREAQALARRLLLEGVVNARSSLGQSFAVVGQALSTAGFIWPKVLFEDLEEALEAYQARSARYHAGTVLTVLAALAARVCALLQGGDLPPRYLLGEGERLETALNKQKLVSLGARMEADGRQRIASVMLADPASRIVLVMEKIWDFEEGVDLPEGPAMVNRSISSSVSLGRAARGIIQTIVAKRMANRRVRLGVNRQGSIDASPQTGDWSQFPPPIRVVSLAKLAEDWDARAPQVLRPPLLAENVHVLELAEIEDSSYDPAEQRLCALAKDAEGTEVLLTRTWQAVSPQALDHIAAALRGDMGKVRFISGELTRHLGRFELDILAIVADRIIVPDIEGEAIPPVAAGGGIQRPHPPVEQALLETLSALEEAVHQGLKGLPTSFVQRLRAAARGLEEVGMEATARRVHRFAEAMRRAHAGQAAEWEDAARCWENAAIRVLLAREAVG